MGFLDDRHTAREIHQLQLCLDDKSTKLIGQIEKATVQFTRIADALEGILKVLTITPKPDTVPTKLKVVLDDTQPK